MKSYVVLIIVCLALGACQPKRLIIKAPIPQKGVVIDSLDHPWGMEFISEEEAFITEKDGNLLRVNLKTKERTIIKGFPDDLFSSFTIEVDKYPRGTYPTSLDGRSIRGNCGILDIKVDPEWYFFQPGRAD